MGYASVECAAVMRTGQVATAAAARKLLRVWQKTSSCATVGGTASVESASVCHSTKGRPVRTALFV